LRHAALVEVLELLFVIDIEKLLAAGAGACNIDL
jgi:hypothetical protein